MNGVKTSKHDRYMQKQMSHIVSIVVSLKLRIQKNKTWVMDAKNDALGTYCSSALKIKFVHYIDLILGTNF